MKKIDKSTYGVLIFMISTTLIGKVLGLLRDILMARNYGISMETDAFFAASRLPTNFFDLALGAAISSTFIPVFNGILHKEEREKAYVYANQFTTCVGTIGLVMTVLMTFFASPVMRVFGPGFNQETFELAVVYSRYMYPIIFFASISFTFTGIMQSLNRFNVPAAISVFSNLAVIAYLIFLNDRFHMVGLAVATTIGWGIQMLFQMPFLKKENYQFKLDFNWRNENMRRTVLILLPILVSSWAQPINAFLNTIFATSIEGGVSTIEYANKVFIIVSGIIILALTNYTFPAMSRKAADHDKVAFFKLVRQTIHMFLYFAAPLTVLLFIYSRPIMQILFERGEFVHQATIDTSNVLVLYAIGLISLGLKEILSRAFFAQGNSKIPMRITLIGVAVNIIGSYSLIQWIGVKGLALSTTISATVMMILSIIYIRKMDSSIFNAKALLKMLFSSALLFLFVTLTNYFIVYQTSKLLLMTLGIMVTSLIALILYIMVLKLLKIPMPSLKISD